MTVDTSRFRTHLPPAAPQEPPGRRPAVRLRRLGLQTTPERIRALAAVAVLAIGGFYIVANIAIGNARDGLRVIGHDAGPQVLATGDLYYALAVPGTSLVAARRPLPSAEAADHAGPRRCARRCRGARDRRVLYRRQHRRRERAGRSARHRA